MTTHNLGPLRISLAETSFRQSPIPGLMQTFSDRVVRIEHDNPSQKGLYQFDVPAMEILQEVYYAIIDSAKNPRQHVMFEGYGAAVAFETHGEEIVFGDNFYKLIGRQNRSELLDLTKRYLAGEIALAVSEGRISEASADQFPVKHEDVLPEMRLVLS